MYFIINSWCLLSLGITARRCPVRVYLTVMLKFTIILFILLCSGLLFLPLLGMRYCCTPFWLFFLNSIDLSISGLCCQFFYFYLFPWWKRKKKSRKNDPVFPQGPTHARRFFAPCALWHSSHIYGSVLKINLTFSWFSVNLQSLCFLKSSFLQSAGFASFHINIQCLFFPFFIS